MASPSERYSVPSSPGGPDDPYPATPRGVDPRDVEESLRLSIMMNATPRRATELIPVAPPRKYAVATAVSVHAKMLLLSILVTILFVGPWCFLENSVATLAAPVTHLSIKYIATAVFLLLLYRPSRVKGVLVCLFAIAGPVLAVIVLDNNVLYTWLPYVILSLFIIHWDHWKVILRLCVPFALIGGIEYAVVFLVPLQPITLVYAIILVLIAYPMVFYLAILLTYVTNKDSDEVMMLIGPLVAYYSMLARLTTFALSELWIICVVSVGTAVLELFMRIISRNLKNYEPFVDFISQAAYLDYTGILSATAITLLGILPPGGLYSAQQGNYITVIVSAVVMVGAEFLTNCVAGVFMMRGVKKKEKLSRYVVTYYSILPLYCALVLNKAIY